MLSEVSAGQAAHNTANEASSSAAAATAVTQQQPSVTEHEVDPGPVTASQGAQPGMQYRQQQHNAGWGQYSGYGRRFDAGADQRLYSEQYTEQYHTPVLMQPMPSWPCSPMQYWKPAVPVVLQPAPGYGYPVVPMVVPHGTVVLATPLSPHMVQLQQQHLQQHDQQQRRMQRQPPHPPYPPNGMAPHHPSMYPSSRGRYTGSTSNGKVSSSSRRSSVSAACSVSSDFGSTIADDSSISSLCRTASTQWIVSPRGSQSTSLPEGVENLSWAWLVDGILQQVVQYLTGHNSLQSFRGTCRHWRAVADQNIRQLAPRCLKPKDLVSLFPRLQVLELVQCPNVRNRDLYVLAQSPIQLRCLTLGDDTNKPWVTNKGLSSIGRMSSLQSLALHDCNSITNNGMQALSELRHLSSLSLRGCRKITNNGLEVLQANSALTSLNLHGCKRISDKGLNAVSNLPLRALSLGLTRVKDEGMAYLARLTQLTELHCTNEELTDEGIHHLSSLTDLNTLALRDCCEVSGDALLALLPSLPHLAHLNLYKNWEFGDEQLVKCCVHMLGIVSLDFRGTMVTDAGLGECTQLSNLRHLALKPHPNLADNNMLVVSRLTQLRSLALCLPSYNRQQLDGIKQLTALKDLDLSSDAFGVDLTCAEPLPSQVVTTLTSMTHLTSLDLSRRPLTERQLHEVLKRLPLLRMLTIHGVPISNEQVSRLERHHPDVNIYKRNSVLETMPELATLLGSLSVT
eukprot:GHUV01003426.1.p1 GENE.GHUV01003426.1~~GHUV01003426.1.p1  ORF type:complete len:738 (+),score=210.60 GHUV01003426.1:346-2559(+)